MPVVCGIARVSSLLVATSIRGTRTEEGVSVTDETLFALAVPRNMIRNSVNTGYLLS